MKLSEITADRKVNTALHEILCEQRAAKDDLPEGIICSCEPFPHCIIKNLIDESLVDDLESSVQRLKYYEKNNDLYKFKQTKALEKSTEPAIKSLRSTLSGVRDWLSKLFNVKLNDKIDMFSARYNYTDTLLCHDDELEGRRIAYIYYLVPNDWTSEDGGALDLFSTHPETGLPQEIAKSITPVRNSLLFFEVTHKSFHQVAEVLAQSKCRLSVSGWFHGPPAARPALLCTESRLSEVVSPVDINEDELYASINGEYINPLTQSDIQERFEEDSEIQLSDFLSVDNYEALCEDIKQEGIVWKRHGPAIKRNVELAEISSLPQSVSDCIKLLTSDAMFLILSNVTGLKLHPLASDSDSEEEPQAKKPKAPPAAEDSGSTAAEASSSSEACGSVSYQVRRWSHGCYTLLHDKDGEQGEDSALDAVIHFNCEGWDESQGGFTSYIAKGDDEELLTLEPRRNCLSLVYRDSDSLGFVKHVNHRITRIDHPYVYDISLVYKEPE